MVFANIIVDISHEKLDKSFQYIVPDGLLKEIHVGNQVEIPFGKGNRIITGYVVELTDSPEFEIDKMKNIMGIKKGSIPVESQMIELAWFIKERYGCTMNKALKTVLPVKQKVKNKEKKYVSLNVSREEARELLTKYLSGKKYLRRAEVIEELLKNDQVEMNSLSEMFGVSESIINNLEKDKIVKIQRDTVYRNPVCVIESPSLDIQLSNEQIKVVNDIENEISRQKGGTHLIFGVTGSGKTEVYMELIADMISQGKEVIMMIPEISLTYQTIKRFYKRFGNQVSIINSRLSHGEKYDQFERAKNGEIKIMIGPRTALFTPFKNLGLIIIDEEHDGAYKSDKMPKYHTRDVAIKRAQIQGAAVVLGSATPSVESFYRAKKGEYSLHRLDKRAGLAVLPEVKLVDMRRELKSGNRDAFSRELVDLIEDRLAKKEQIILFLNRRGYSSFVSCRECGKTIKCPHCDVSLTLHKDYEGGKLVCHYCGHSIVAPKKCPECDSKYIGRFGIGTEQVEERIKTLFPNARVLRLDMDTTRGKDGHEKILSSFANGEADILIGTQMVVKGHDFFKVTLVGILAADLSLNAPDYMASERTFSLITQAAGRAGRGDLSGEVVVQSYSPENECIQKAIRQDYEGFYEYEIDYRKIMGYPPVQGMCVILISHINEKFLDRVSKDVAGRIEKSKIDGLVMLGPSKATISKINNVYRNVIYIKHDSEEVISKIEAAIMRYVNMVESYKDIVVQFDYNPMSGY